MSAHNLSKVRAKGSCILMITAAVAVNSHPRAAAGPPGAQASFQGLGDLPGGEYGSWAWDVSNDGSIVVGESLVPSGPLEAFRWTEETGMVGLGSLPGSGSAPFSQAYGVSADGLAVVGRSLGNFTDAEAFQWTLSDGIIGLGAPPNTWTYAQAASGDGAAVVGRIDSLDASGVISEAFRWTEATGMVGLGDLPGGAFSSYALGVSGDGSVVVGAGRVDSESGCSGYEAFRWTSQTGMVALGAPPGDTCSQANDVSHDGTTIVGSSNGQAFRWTAGSGMVGLGPLTHAWGVSGNGTVVVGRRLDDNGSEPMVWDTARGARTLRGLLVDEYGLDLSGWTLIKATEVSGDGRTIVGQGINPNGDWEAWRAVLPSCAPCQLFGDVSPAAPEQGDCAVDVDDLVYIVGAYGAADPCLNFPGSNLVPCGQVCTEGLVDVDELVAIVRAYAGIYDCPSPCGP
jgi:probable HAF family extracellular repeat protein